MGHIFFGSKFKFGQILRLIQGKTLEQTRMICPSLRLKHTLNFFSEILMVHCVGSAILFHSIAAGQIGFYHVSITS